MFERYIENIFCLTVPETDNRYIVDIRDMSVSDNGVLLSGCYDSNGELFFKLKWYDGFRLYPMSEIVNHAFKPVKFNTIYWKLLKVLHKDGNKSNNHPSNLVWKYPLKLGIKEHHGFSFIPMFSRYMINSKGVIFDMSRKRFVKGRFVKGYFTYVLFNDIGDRTVLSRHRALGLVFLDYPADVDEKHINHKNGIKGDDRVKNLEWVTCSENRLHALDIGLVSIRKPVVIENEVTGEVTIVKSIKEALVKVGVSKNFLSKSLNSISGVFNKWPWKVYLHKSSEEDGIVSNKTKILVRNMKNGKITEYESLVGCAKDLNISKYTVAARVEDQWDKVHPDGLQIRRKTENVKWFMPENPEQVILDSNWVTSCLVRFCDSGDVVSYSSQREASKALGLSEATIHNLINNQKQPVFKGYNSCKFVQIKKCNDQGGWRIPDDYISEYLQSIAKKIVIVRNTHTNEEVEFESAVECAKKLNILPTTLNWRLKTKGQKIFDKKFQFKYKSEIMSFKA